MLDAVAEDGLDRTCECVVGVADDHARRSFQGTEERLPGGLILMWKGLKPPYRRGGRPLPGRGQIATRGREHVKAAAGALTGPDPEVHAVDQQRMRPPLGQLAGAHQAAEHIDPVGHDLTIPRRIATPPAGWSRGRARRALASTGSWRASARERAGASITARKALGFEELLSGDADAMQRRTRNYARRQLTWMRKLAGVNEIDVTGGSAAGWPQKFSRSGRRRRSGLTSAQRRWSAHTRWTRARRAALDERGGEGH